MVVVQIHCHSDIVGPVYLYKRVYRQSELVLPYVIRLEDWDGA